MLMRNLCTNLGNWQNVRILLARFKDFRENFGFNLYMRVSSICYQFSEILNLFTF